MSRLARAIVVVAVGIAFLAVLAAAGAFAPLYTTGGYHPATPSGTADGTEATPTPSAYEQATVVVVAGDTNETLGRLRVAVADSYDERYTGLSKTEHLPEDRGMLFVYDEPGDHTYVMRGMDFGIDILYVGANGTIRRIHHAPEPPEGADGNDYEYPGSGQYVLEVNYDWTVRHDVSVGDRLVVSGLPGNTTGPQAFSAPAGYGAYAPPGVTSPEGDAYQVRYRNSLQRTL